MKSITFNTLQDKLLHYFDLVSQSDETVIIPRNNDENAVVMMSLEEYNSLKETAYLLSTEANRKHLEESIIQMEKGETVPYTDFDEQEPVVAH